MQAEQQLEKGWELMKAGTPGCPDMEEWLVSVLPEGSRVGIDPFLHTVSNSPFCNCYALFDHVHMDDQRMQSIVLVRLLKWRRSCI